MLNSDRTLTPTLTLDSTHEGCLQASLVQLEGLCGIATMWRIWHIVLYQAWCAYHAVCSMASKSICSVVYNVPYMNNICAYAAWNKDYCPYEYPDPGPSSHMSIPSHMWQCLRFDHRVQSCVCARHHHGSPWVFQKARLVHHACSIALAFVGRAALVVTVAFTATPFAFTCAFAALTVAALTVAALARLGRKDILTTVFVRIISMS